MTDCIDKKNLGNNLGKERGGNLPTLVSGKGRDGKRVKKLGPIRCNMYGMLGDEIKT